MSHKNYKALIENGRQGCGEIGPLLLAFMELIGQMRLNETSLIFLEKERGL